MAGRLGGCQRPRRAVLGGPASTHASFSRVRPRLTRAYQNGDVDGLVAVLTEDVLMTMPPIPLEYLGRELVARFLRAAIFRPGIACQPVLARANGQPALVMYVPDQQPGITRASGVLVFALSGSRVSAITRFDETVLPRFGVPATLPS